MIYYYRISVLRVIDGDTIIADIDLGFGVWITDRLRLASIDAPELHGETKELGLQAKQYLSEVLSTQEAVFAQTFKDKRCKYGRMLATLFGLDGLNINDLLVKHGHARRVAMFCERLD